MVESRERRLPPPGCGGFVGGGLVTYRTQQELPPEGAVSPTFHPRSWNPGLERLVVSLTAGRRLLRWPSCPGASRTPRITPTPGVAGPLLLPRCSLTANSAPAARGYPPSAPWRSLFGGIDHFHDLRRGWNRHDPNRASSHSTAELSAWCAGRWWESVEINATRQGQGIRQPLPHSGMHRQ